MGPSAHPDQILKDLKQMQKDKMEERRMMANDGGNPKASKKINSSLPSIHWMPKKDSFTKTFETKH